MRNNISLATLASMMLISIVLTIVPAQTVTGSKSPGDDLTLHSVGTWGLDLTDRDPSIRPGDDFYMSQNGGWFKRTVLTSRRSAYWADVRGMSSRRLTAILKDAAADKNASPESIEGKAGALYRAYIDEKRIEALGLSPLQPELDAIRAAKTKAQFATLTGSIGGPGTVRSLSALGRPLGRGIFSVNVDQDRTDPNRYAVYVGRGGLLLPGQEYYLDPQLADIKNAYQSYVAKILTMIGWPNPESSAKEIVAFETRIAEGGWSRERMRAENGAPGAITVNELSKIAPGFDWREFFHGAEIGNVDKVVIGSKPVFTHIATIFSETPIEVLQARQAFDAADNGATNLNSAMLLANGEFRTKLFNGQSSPLLGQRPNRAERVVEANLTEIVGALYVKHYSSPEVKAKAQEMAANLKNAFDARLEKLNWLSSESKARARNKLAKMTIKTGHPDKFEKYDGLKIDENDLYGDVVRAGAFNWRQSVRKLNQPFDRSAWQSMPNYAQYGYDPLTNSLEAPDALLQPPFFDLKADDAVNYGAAGSLIGLMIATGFDMQGGQYDGDGRRADLLTANESKKFQAEARKLSDQYSAFEPLPGMHLKGDLLLPESLGGLAGTQMAIDAYHLSLKGKPAPVIDGFSGDQRFFLGKAQMWRAKFSEDFVRNQTATATNAPPFVRINGPLPNMDAWYSAFDVKPGDKMYLAPDQRVRIW